MNILILTGKFGMGHYSVSASLLQQIQHCIPDANILTVDFIQYAMPQFSQTIYQTFRLLVSNWSGMYNQYYKMTQDGKTDIRPVFLSHFLSKLQQLLEQEQPQVILSTLPFCSQLVSQYKRKYHVTIPLITCITDISSHSEWINHNTDYYLVGGRRQRQSLVEKGVAEEKILIIGIPVKEEFKRTFLKNTGIGTINLLMMGGGLGLLPLSLDFYENLNSLPNTHTTVLTGNNQVLYEKLQGIFPHVSAVAYTDQVYRYMQNADAILTKPGGITLFETIFSETPLIVCKPSLQQEVNNANFVYNNQIGIVLPTKVENCFNEIKEFLYDNQRLQTCLRNIRELKIQLNTNLFDELMKRFLQIPQGVYAS